MPTEPTREQPHTYIVQDQNNLEELQRLEIQDKMITTAMGGVLPELTDHSHLQRILDVGCGTGAWLLETARTYPTIEKLIGGDINSKMLEYARSQAESSGFGGRVQFRKVDALRPLDFPSGFFDLVNQRLGFSWLRTWEWQKVLLEYERVSRPGGIIRITESNITSECNSPALTKLYQIGLETFFRSGHLFTERTDGTTSELAPLMKRHGFEDVQTRLYEVVYRPGTQMFQYFYEDMLHGFRLAVPFFRKWVHVPNDYDDIYQQALKDMQQPDFVATGTLVTAWGSRSKNEKRMFLLGLK